MKFITGGNFPEEDDDTQIHRGMDIMDPVTAQHQHYPFLNLIHPFYIPQEWRRNWLNKVELILMSESSRRHQQRPGKGVGRENPPPKKIVVGVEPPLPSTQRYQCGYPEYLIQGWRGRGNDLWWGIKLSEMENTLLKKVYWAIWSRKVLTMTSRREVGVGKLIIWVRCGRYLSRQSLLDIQHITTHICHIQPDLNPRIIQKLTR